MSELLLELVGSAHGEGGGQVESLNTVGTFILKCNTWKRLITGLFRPIITVNPFLRTT